MDIFLQELINGVALGAVYALIALGFALVFSVLRMMNFAHGDTYMVGVFVVLGCLQVGLLAPLALLLGAATAAVLAALVERIAYRPLRSSHPMMPVMTALAAAVVLRQIVVFVWGVQTLPFPQLMPVPFNLGQLQISGTQTITLIVAIGCVVGFRLFLDRTKWGRAILLMRQDLEVARLMGIPVDEVVTLVYALAGLLGVIGGVLYCTNYGVIDAQMGINMTVNGFIASVLGGLGGLEAALVGGLLLGVVQQLTAAYLSSSWQTAVSFTILIVVLLVRPNGLVPGQAAPERA
ncbi:MAG: branched-chain amino acid ABC transporter permease [Candidatus Limnocylindrales bacterium]